MYNKDLFSLVRYITPKSDLKIFKNDVDLSGKGIRESEKKLQELIPELNKDLIASTIIIGQGMPNKFSSFSPSGRKDLLEKISEICRYADTEHDRSLYFSRYDIQRKYEYGRTYKSSEVS